MASRSLHFNSEDALRAAITAGLVPSEIVDHAASVVRHAEGGLVVTTERPLSKAVLQPLLAAGVVVTGPTGYAQPICCWAEALVPQRERDPEARTGVVLFVVPEGDALLEVAAELLRLGCDRQEFRSLTGKKGTTGLLRVANPPYYTIMRALEGSEVRAYLPTPAGQDLVWTEMGWEHPLVDLVRAPAGQLLLIPGNGDWRTLTLGPWTDIYQLFELQVPPVTPLVTVPPPQLTVPLRLAPAARAEPASLWVLRVAAVAQVDRLRQQLPADTLERLLYAVGGTPEAPIVVLRARLGRQVPPALQLQGEAYAPLLSIGNLFAPVDKLLEPPLRRDRLRALLVPSVDRITWLAPVGDGGGFTPESLPDAAFAPLTDWVDYLVHTAAHTLEPWVNAATFDFTTFEEDAPTTKRSRKATP
jgi:hypothetical protein